MARRATFSEHLELLYSTLEAPERWQEFLAEVAQSVNAQSGIVSVDQVAQQRLLVWVTHGFDQAAMQAYAGHYSTTDVWARALASRAAGRFHPSHELASEADFLGSEFRADWAGPIGMRHATGAYIDGHDGLATRVAFQRNVRQGRFEPETLRYLDTLAPHVHRAARLGREWQRLRLSRRLDAVGDDPACCRFLLNGRLQLLALNLAAERALAVGTLPLTERGGRLVMSDPGDEAELRRRLRPAVAFAPGEPAAFDAIVLGARSARPQRATLAPFPASMGELLLTGADGAWLLSLQPALPVDAPRRPGEIESLQLTGAERSVLDLLLLGLGQAEIAERRCRSRETVRSQVRSLLRKADCRNTRALLARFARRD